MTIIGIAGLTSVLLNMISVSQLLSSCMDASRIGCEVIRDFRATQITTKEQNNDNGQTISTGTLKEEGDIRSVVTQADVDAQAKIVGGLKALWGDQLRIIGEEDDDDCNYSNPPTLRTDLLSSLSDDNDNDQVPIEELTVFVDPLDGTREFVEGRVENVACLVGIARNKRSLGGIIGLPFPNGKTNANVVVHYALLDDYGDGLCSGTWEGGKELVSQLQETKEAEEDKEQIISVLAGDSKDPILRNAKEACLSSTQSIMTKLNANKNSSSPPKQKLIGGTAAKLRTIALGSNSITVLHFKTMLWDTCGPAALLQAKNGKITDLFGSPLVHAPKSDETYGNVFGVVASSGESHMAKLHDELCATMRANTNAVETLLGNKYMGGSAITGPQAVDVARDLDGVPLDVSWISSHIAGDEAALKAYTAPESDAIRGMMSNGCRLMLHWNHQGDDDNGNDDKNKNLPSSVFYKRVVMGDLAHSRHKLKTTPHKVERDVKSYQVETAFLTSKACQNGLREEAGVHVNRVYGADLRPRKSQSPIEQMESRFALLLEDFSEQDGWTQQWLLDEKASRAALQAFAKMHGYFWQGSKFWSHDGGQLGKDLEEAVWSNGGYMQPALQGYSQLEKVADGWKARLPDFKDDLKGIEELQDVDLNTLGERLEKVAKTVGVEAHPFAKDSNLAKDMFQYRTLIHGDPKQSNIFFRKRHGRKSNDCDSDGNDDLEVGLIDFQWSGFGLAATDVAHTICAALQPSCISYDGSKENELLDYYYECLVKSLVENGVASTEKDVHDHVFPRHVLQKQYDSAVLDIGRMVFAYAWARWKAESTPTAASFNRNAYNKSTKNALWLVVRVSEILSAREKAATSS